MRWAVCARTFAPLFLSRTPRAYCLYTFFTQPSFAEDYVLKSEGELGFSDSMDKKEQSLKFLQFRITNIFIFNLINLNQIELSAIRYYSAASYAIFR